MQPEKEIKKIPDEAKIVFKGILHEVWQWQQEMFDGSFEIFEAIRRKSSTTVLAITEDDKIIINFEEQPNLKPFFSIPAGMLEDGLSPLENIKKELEEETGFSSEEWIPWETDDVLKNNKIDWVSYSFIARKCVKTGNVKFDPGEKIETVLLDFPEFLKITQDERFRIKKISEKIKQILESENVEEEKENFRKFLFGENV